ncbi:MAG: NrdJb, partial [Alphaproteobacteria bacterium]|nr:NrdJb [Alphaproteobacteria bacterium]
MKIEKRIVKYRVRKPQERPTEKAAAASDPDVFQDKNGKTAKVIRMHEKVER